MAKSDFQVGQIVYEPASGGYREHTISKVGRKWAHVQNNRSRFDLETMQMDDGGRVYRSPEEHMAGVELFKAWQIFKGDVGRQWRVPEAVTYETIAAARKLLGL